MNAKPFKLTPIAMPESINDMGTKHIGYMGLAATLTELAVQDSKQEENTK